MEGFKKGPGFAFPTYSDASTSFTIGPTPTDLSSLPQKNSLQTLLVMYYFVELVNLLLLLWHCAFALNFIVLCVAVFFIALIISTCVTDPMSPTLNEFC